MPKANELVEKKENSRRSIQRLFFLERVREVFVWEKGRFLRFQK